MIPTREILWNVPHAAVTSLYVLCAAALAWIAVWFYRRSRVWAEGAPTEAQKVGIAGWGEGLVRLGEYLLRHRTILRDPYAGVMHLLIFWGFMTELLATTLVAIQHDFGIVFLTGNFYLVFSLAADLGGVALGAGLVMALWRRRSPSRLLPSRGAIALIALLLAVTVTGFFLEAARIAAVGLPSFERWSVVGYWLARVFPLGAGAHRLLWLFHAALVVAFFAVIPLTLMRHVILGAYSLVRPPKGLGAMELRSIDLLHSDACLTCGRCAEACPAHAAGKPLSPRSVVLNLRSGIADDVLWSCTTCNACDSACPIGIRIVDKIVTLRRGRVFEGELPAAAAAALEASGQRSNPFDRPNSARLEWASGLSVPVAKEGEPVDLLYWVGCAGAFDPAGKEVTRAMVKILGKLGVSYRVLGCNERCSGDPARRLGEEGLWEDLARANQKQFSAHGVKTILTQCPHCYNAFRNEYPEVGPMPRVVHHSQWLREQIDTGKIAATANGERVTFHDPCYLGRVNGEVEAPRAILGSVVEMEAHGKQSFCCGGGGGQPWLDVRGKTRVETVRAEHAEKTGATTVATGCPFCRVMLEAGRGSLPEGQGKWRVRDLAELVAEAMP